MTDDRRYQQPVVRAEACFQIPIAPADMPRLARLQ